MLCQPEGVQNQSNLAIAHNGGSGKTGNALQLFAQWFHDDLFGVIDFIHHQAKLAAIGLQNDDVDCLFFHRLILFAVKLQFPVEVDDRQQVSAQTVDGYFLDHLDAHLRRLAFEPHQLHQAHLRYSEALPAGRDNQGRG